MTQGMALPPMKRAKSGFLRMRIFCGNTEVTPIHPFVVEHRISETEAIDEGLYVFDPAAFGPPCGTVRLTVYSKTSPTKATPASSIRGCWSRSHGTLRRSATSAGRH